MWKFKELRVYSIDLIRVDERTGNVVVLYGEDGYLEIDASGQLVPEEEESHDG